MAIKIGSLFGDVSLRTANLDKSIASVGKKMRKLGTNLTAAGKKLSIGLTAPIAAFGAVSVKAFVAQEKAENALRAALQASGQEVDSNFNKLKRMASEIQKVTTVGDEMSLSLMQQATSMGLSADQLDEATRGAIGLSKAFNLDLKMAMRASTAALQGQTEMLTRYIPELKNIEDPAERVALVHAKMAEGFNLATEEANTTSGQMDQLNNAFGDLQEQIGAIVAEYLTPLIEKLRSVVARLQEADPAMLRLGVQIAAIAAALGPLLIVLGQLFIILPNVVPLIKKLAIVFSSAYTWTIALGVGLGLLFNKLGFLKEAGEALGEVVVRLFEKDWPGALQATLHFLWELVNSFVPIEEGIAMLWRTVRPFFEFFTQQIAHVVGGLNMIYNAFKKIASVPGALGNAIGRGISNIAYRADGGPVSAGAPYIVGEAGPELFVPRYSGSIVPNHALAGQGSTNSTNITMNFAPGIGMDVITALKNSKHIIAEMALDAVRENNLRTL